MSLSIAASQALATASANTSRGWVGGAPGTSAADRMTTGNFVSIGHQPKFSIGKDTKIFTMGSCFAREVENSLVATGVPLVTKGMGLPPEKFDSWDEDKEIGGGVKRGMLSRGCFNKYTVSSMTHEIRRVLLDEQHENDGLIELQPNLWFDPHAAGLKAGPFDDVQDSRKQIAKATAKIKEAEVVFLTLGLIEGWLDTATGLAMNRAPTGRNLVRLSSRLRFVIPSYAETLADLKECISLIRSTCNPQMKFVLTVSPVPFHATFRAIDVIVANNLSKALLRTVTDEVVQTVPDVDYFPSYEIVTNSPRSLAWRPDQMHVEKKMVGHVIKSFTEAYIGA